MVAAEWIEGTYTDPVGKKFGIRSSFITSQIRTTKRLTGKSQVKNHWRRHFKVFPGRSIVACPGCCIPLTTDIIGTRKHKGTFFRIYFEDTIPAGFYHHHSVGIVVPKMNVFGQIAATAMNVVFGHGCIRAIKYLSLIHIVPNPVDAGSHKIFIQASPPFTGFGTGKVGKSTCSWPYISIKLFAAAGFYPMISGGSLVVNVVARFFFYSGIDHVNRFEIDGM